MPSTYSQVKTDTMRAPSRSCRVLRSAVLGAVLVLSTAQSGWGEQGDAEFDALLSMDISQLTVTSVSLRQQKLSDAAAAVYVITGEDLKRMGVTSIPEALRMAPGVEVAQTASNRWAVNARGFNNALANKMLVLIDGRSVYTPVFSGTYWDDQSTLIADIDRIEVIRGPGGTLYGANAVNGVINITTKHAKDTQGNYAAVGYGTEEKLMQARHGGQTEDGTYYRSYAQMQDVNATANPDGGQNYDGWQQLRAGFRMDGEAAKGDSYTLQGDAYGSEFETQRLMFLNTSPFFQTAEHDESSHGANILGHWQHRASADSDWNLRAYLDHYNRNEAHFEQQVTTADMQFRNNRSLNDRNTFVWGGGARYSILNTEDSFGNAIYENDVARHTVNLFAQNEYALIPETLYVTLGSKIEHNAFTGVEIQPNARASWRVSDTQTVWAAVSRAVRTPSEIEDQAVAVIGVAAGTPPTAFSLGGTTNADSETLIAYEIGHRIQPSSRLSIDTTLFYNDYDDLFAFGQFGAAQPREGTSESIAPFINIGAAKTYGIEMATNWNVTDTWRLSGTFSHSRMDVETPASALAAAYSSETMPQNQLSLRSYWNITKQLQWDNMVYYVDEISAPADAYIRYDTRLGWQAMPGVEVSVIGRNLLDGEHAEFNGFPQAELERSVLGMVTLRF